MKEYFLLKLLDRFKPLFVSFGIDFPMMRRIIQLKLTMDERRVPTVMARGNRSEGKGAYRSSLIMYGFIGLFIGLLILPDYPMYFKMNLVFGMLLFMIMTTMISDFSSVLLDIKDKNILLTRPVEAKTLNAAKLIHIVYYLLSITLAISGVSLIAGLIRYGVVFFLMFLVSLLLIVAFIILLTSILYFLILHFFSGEKLKDIINYFQIILSIFMVVMYQFVGRIFNIAEIHTKVTPQWWNFLLPSSWFAAPFALFIDHSKETLYLYLTLAAVLIPLLALILYLKVAAPAFERNLQKLSTSDGGGRDLKKSRLSLLLTNLLCRNKLEKTFFRFTHMMLSNERKLKLKIYPSLAFAVIMPFVFLFSIAGTTHSFSEFLSALAHGRYYISLYFSAAFLCPLVLMLSTSENYKGAWIYRALPVDNPALVLKGALKAFITKYVVPVYLIAGAIFTTFCGLRIVPDLILIFLNMLGLLLVIFMMNKKELPFYKNFSTTQGGSNTAVVFVSLGLCGAFAGVHYLLLRLFAPGVYIFMGVSLLAVILLWRLSFRFTWRDIARDE